MENKNLFPDLHRICLEKPGEAWGSFHPFHEVFHRKAGESGKENDRKRGKGGRRGKGNIQKVLNSGRLWLREGFCQEGGIGGDDEEQQQVKEEAAFGGEAGCVGESAGDVDCGVGDDAGQEALAPVENQDEQEADGNGPGDLE